MATQRDDALEWGGEGDDPSYLPGTPRLADGVDEPDANNEPDANGEASLAGGAALAPATGSASLVLFGILSGVFVLYSVGWILASFTDTFAAPDLVSQVMYELGQFLAIVAPLLWLLLALVFTRHSRAIIRLSWLLAGVLLLAPWPFITRGLGA